MFIKSSKYISYAIPTPQIELLATIATSPAHRVPCLNSKKKQYIKLFQMNLIITCFHSRPSSRIVTLIPLPVYPAAHAGKTCKSSFGN
jgi:hypothetical protein